MASEKSKNITIGTVTITSKDGKTWVTKGQNVTINIMEVKYEKG